MKLSLLLGAIGIAIVLPTQAMYKPGTMSGSLNAVHSPVKNPTRSYFYSALAMHNAKKAQTALLLADVHVQKPYDTNQHSLTLKQQHDILQIHDIIRDAQKNVHVIVEDSSIFSTNYVPGFMNGWYSPLIGLEAVCKRVCKGDLACTNVEFRTGNSDEITKEAAQDIEKNTNASTLSKINYYGRHTYETPFDSFIDAAIINQVNKIDDPYIIICAGAGHVGIVSKYLFMEGYTNTRIHIAKKLVPAFKNFVVHFDKDAPIPPANLDKARYPDHIQVTDALMSLIREIKT